MTDFNFFIGANGLYLFLLLGLVVNAARFRSVDEQPSQLFTGGPYLRKIIAWGSGGLLLLSVLFNTGQMLSSILRTEASGIALPKASPHTLAYLRDSLTRASFLDPLEPSHHYLLGRAAAAASDNISEQRSYLSAVRLSPSNAEYLQALGSAMENAGNTAAAAKLFTESVSRARTDAFVIRQYGGFLLRVGKKEDALHQFRAALSLEPQKIRDYTELLVLEGLSDTDILSIIPEDADSLITFAEYLDATGSHDKALSAYDGAAAILLRDPSESPGIYWRISQFASRKSRYKEALEILQLATDRFPKDIMIRLAMAGYFEKLGTKDQAAAAYQGVLGLEPENKTAKQRLQAITAETTTLH